MAYRLIAKSLNLQPLVSFCWKGKRRE